MSPIEWAALAILVGAALVLVVLALVWQYLDRRPLDPPEPEPAPVQDHHPRHADWEETTRLWPSD